MKKILYISFLLISTLLVSCSKQDVSPIVNESIDTPTWDTSEKSSGSEGVDDGIDDGVPVDGDGNEIVDPRFDPDGKGK